eukprot:GHVL01012881.1.p1 GENE.GHVL01012881.1~~GHVL01012881.1.p1  ORF type:complete len:158 (+),score=44.38 GHVL01012881.1:277-750(+)
MLRSVMTSVESHLLTHIQKLEMCMKESQMTINNLRNELDEIKNKKKEKSNKQNRKRKKSTSSDGFYSASETLPPQGVGPQGGEPIITRSQKRYYDFHKTKNEKNDKKNINNEYIDTNQRCKQTFLTRSRKVTRGSTTRGGSITERRYPDRKRKSTQN